jgi:3-dehydroquinate synthase
MRGMRFGFVSTTLLAQVDASVGGKNGVNFGGYKNMVGVFNQPDFVICDMALLKSLPIRESCAALPRLSSTVPSPMVPCWIF